ncbi:MAG: hypothetical protein ACRC7N_06905 [Clostridium sp.]
MSKKIIALLLAVGMTVTIVGCGKDDKEKAQNNVRKITFEDKYEALSGSWAENMTYEIAEGKFNELYKKMEDQTKVYGLKYDKKEVAKDVEGLTENEKYIYLDNEKPDKNKLESFYFGFKTYGEKLDAGQIQLKVSLNFDGENAIKDGKFKFEDTSIAKYSSIFTGVENRKYDEVNKQIIEILKSEKGEGVIESNVEGLYEEFTVSKDCIVYRLETKKFDFIKAKQENPTNVE